MKRIDTPAYIIFVLLVSILSWKVNGLSRENDWLLAENKRLTNTERQQSDEKALIGQTLDGFTLDHINREGTFTYPTGDIYHLFIFYTATDCYSCFSEIPFWQRLADEYDSRMNVIGITTGSHIEKAHHFINRQRITIPVLHDVDGSVFASLDVLDAGLTPLKVLVDPEGKIVDAACTTYNHADKQEAYMELLDSIFRR